MRRLGGLAVAVSWLALAASPTLAAEAGAEGGGGIWYKGLIALAAGLGLGLAAFGAALAPRRRRRWSRSVATRTRPIASSRL